MPHQVQFVYDRWTPIQGFVGGYRAGKTEALTWKSLLCATEWFPGEHGVIISPISGMNQRNVVPILRRILPSTGLEYDVEALANKRVDYLDIKVGQKMSRIWLGVSAENYTRMNGMSLAWGGFDEADLCRSADIAYNAFVELGNRLSEAENTIQFAVSTPEGYAFMHRRFVEEASEQTKIWHVRMTDNFLLPQGYIESRLKNIPANKQDAYINGLFANIFSSTVYNCFDRNLNHSDLSLKDVSRHEAIHIGMDFNVEHMAGIVHIIVNNEPIAVDEIIDIYDTPAMIAEIRRRYPTRPIIVYPDASGKNRNVVGKETSMALLRQAGFKVIVDPSNPAVGDRINSMNAAFQNAAGERRYKVNTKLCPTYTKCLERQAWVKSKTAGSSAMEPDKSNNVDHPLDAGGYFIHKLWPVKGKAQLRSQ
jgi:hypothetical protein